MAEIIVPAARCGDDLTLLIAAGPPAGRLNGAKLRLFGNNIDPDPDTLLSDFNEVTFAGYTAGGYVVTWTAPVRDGRGGYMTTGNAVAVVAGAVAAAETAYGYYAVNAAGTALEFSQRFDSPAGFEAAGDSLVIVPVYRQGPIAA